MSTVDAVRIDPSDPLPPYEQLRRQFADLILAGVLTEGDRLPPLRQVAADLGLAVGTVGRAYRELEAEGLVRSRRGAGTRVRALPAAEPAAHVEETLCGHAEELVRQAMLLGADHDAVRAAVERALASFGSGSGPAAASVG